MDQIKIKIGKDGAMSYEVHGVKGESCKDLTKLLDAMGKGVVSKDTPEMFEKKDEPNRLTNFGG